MKKKLDWKNKNAKFDYLLLLKKDNSSSAIKYSMKQNHQLGDLIEHSTFGLGFIQKIVSPNKIEVFFDDAEKTLIQNMK